MEIFKGLGLPSVSLFLLRKSLAFQPCICNLPRPPAQWSPQVSCELHTQACSGPRGACYLKGPQPEALHHYLVADWTQVLNLRVVPKPESSHGATEVMAIELLHGPQLYPHS